MSETSTLETISEEEFLPLLEFEARAFLDLGQGLLATSETWTRRHFDLVHSKADDLEAFLDDYGARSNQRFRLLRELVASIRGFALAGFSLAHLRGRLDSYRVEVSLKPDDWVVAQGEVQSANAFVEEACRSFLAAIAEEARTVGLRGNDKCEEVLHLPPTMRHPRLPLNVGHEEFDDEAQRIAEVASKYLQACEMLAQVRVRRMEDEKQREVFLDQHCSEEQARVYEATVHNLQSAYDTYIKDTVIESGDPRLARLRGLISASLHMLEAVTHLVHFVNRHEQGIRHKSTEQRIAHIVPRADVREVTLNQLLYWANNLMQIGRPIAEDLLPTYTNVQVLEVEIGGDLLLHARPAALIVAIVNRHGTPVEMEIEGHACNAGSIMELMIAVGSHSDAKRFVFRGDQYPLRDIALLFDHELAENGIESLPDELGYLRS